MRHLRPRIGKPDQRWKAFLANHGEVIVAFDFFTVPTLTFKLLYCFITHQEELLSKEDIFSSIWGYDIATNSHSLGTYIHLLKKKLRSHGVWLPLENFSGVGYKLGPATIISLFSPVPAAEQAG